MIWDWGKFEEAKALSHRKYSGTSCTLIRWNQTFSELWVGNFIDLPVMCGLEHLKRRRIIVKAELNLLLGRPTSLVTLLLYYIEIHAVSPLASFVTKPALTKWLDETSPGSTTPRSLLFPTYFNHNMTASCKISLPPSRHMYHPSCLIPLWIPKLIVLLPFLAFDFQLSLTCSSLFNSLCYSQTNYFCFSAMQNTSTPFYALTSKF